MRDNCKKYNSDIPYPEIKVLQPNLYYAKLLQEDYAGIVSEFTAINQYIYHSFLIKSIDEEMSETIECIAIEEMHHLKILAELIILLGGKPTFSFQNNVWNSNYVNYGFNLLNQLNSDLQSEYDAIQTYKEHIELIKDPYIEKILQRIILDEETHVKLFKEMISKVESYHNRIKYI